MIKDEVKKKLEGKFKDWFVKNPRRIYFTIDKSNLRSVAEVLYKDFKMRLSTVSGVDNGDNFELIYHFGSDKTGELFNVRVFVYERHNPEVDSLVPMFRATEWVEREIHEMLGIKFIGHPDLKHLLLDHDWPEGNYPLRKTCILEKKPYPQDKEDENG